LTFFRFSLIRQRSIREEHLKELAVCCEFHASLEDAHFELSELSALPGDSARTAWAQPLLNFSAPVVDGLDALH
jgi:hypothetical protein